MGLNLNLSLQKYLKLSFMVPPPQNKQSILLLYVIDA